MKYKKPHRPNKLLGNLIDFLVMLLLFSGPVLNSFLWLFGITATSGQLAIIYLFVDVTSIILYFCVKKPHVPKNLVYTVCVLALILVGFIVTSQYYQDYNSQFYSELKLYLATVPAVLALSLTITHTRHFNINTSLIFYADIALTLILVFLIRTYSKIEGSALIHDDSGFLYQNISYYSAFNVGLSLFLLYERKFRKAITRVLCYVLIVVQVATCLLSGGRGGVLLAIVLITLYVILMLRKNFLLLIPVILVVFVFLFIPIPGIENESIARSLSVFGGGGIDELRADLQAQAISCFLQKPIFGNGIGSVFYLLGIYSHNYVTDILCETGIVGLLLAVLLFVAFVRMAGTAFKTGSMYRLAIVFFICGMVMNTFSGYIWVNQFVMLPLVSVSLSEKNNGQTVKRKSLLKRTV